MHHMHRSTPSYVAIIVATLMVASSWIRSSPSSSSPLGLVWSFVGGPAIVGGFMYLALHLWRARWYLEMLRRMHRAWKTVGNRAESAAKNKGQMRNSDIIVATPEKSGTTWLQHMVHQLRANGAEPTFECQNDIMPQIEQHHEWYNRAATDEPTPFYPRVYKSHMSFGELQACGILPPSSIMELPVVNTNVVNDAKDQRSIWGILRKFSHQRRAQNDVGTGLTNGTAVAAVTPDATESKVNNGNSLSSTPSPSSGPPLQYARAVFCWRGRDATLYSMYRYMPTFMHIHPDWMPWDVFASAWLIMFSELEVNRLKSLREAWHVRNHPNVLFNFFEDLVADHKGSLVRLAKWMNVNEPTQFSDELIERVRLQTTHTVMSSDEHISRFSDLRSRQRVDLKSGIPAHQRLTEAELVECGKVRRKGGRVGDGKNADSFDADIRRRLDRVWERIITKDLGFKSMTEMRRQWHSELAQRGTPLAITLP